MMYCVRQVILHLANLLLNARVHLISLISLLFEIFSLFFSLLLPPIYVTLFLLSIAN